MFQTDFEELLKGRPALEEKYRAFLEVVNNNKHVSQGILELCEAKVREIHGVDDAATAATSEAEEVALAIAEKMPFQHHELTDDDIAAAVSVFGDSGTVALLTAVAFMDATTRLQLTFGGNQRVN